MEPEEREQLTYRNNAVCRQRGAGLILNVSPNTGAASNSSPGMLKLQHLKINTVSVFANAPKEMSCWDFLKKMPYMI